MLVRIAFCERFRNRHDIQCSSFGCQLLSFLFDCDVCYVAEQTSYVIVESCDGREYGVLELVVDKILFW